MVMQKKQKKQYRKLQSNWLTVNGDIRTPIYDLAKLERLEKERDKELASLSIEVKQMLDTFKTKCDKMEREVGNIIKDKPKI